MDGMWANYLQPWQGIAYNTNALKAPPAQLGRSLRSEIQGPHHLPSLQNTEGLPNLFMAAHLATGKPMAEASTTSTPPSRS
jgi:putative spermidine/putrescine transport system substrate-binding protein